MRAVLGVLLGVVARLWLATLRLRVEISPELASAAREGDDGDDARRPWVFVFFHGTQWPLLAWKRPRPTVVMVSHSKDGAMQSGALGLLGFAVVRGSSSRGGARALAAVVRRLRRGDADAAFAVDGPRGPYGIAKAGALLAAQRSGGMLVPMGAAAARGKVFTRAWDRFVLAWPFSRVTVVLGPPLEASASPDDVSAAIGEANARARRQLAGSGSNVLGYFTISGEPPNPAAQPRG